MSRSLLLIPRRGSGWPLGGPFLRCNQSGDEVLVCLFRTGEILPTKELVVFEIEPVPTFAMGGV